MYSVKQDLIIVEDAEANYKKGYIKTFRSIEDHWINSNPYYFQAFIRIIMRVNHTYNTIYIEGELLECKRGQSLYSLNSWMDIFNKKLRPPWWSIQKIRTFFKLLQKDNMIILEGLRKTTRLTMCNYESYQDNQHTANTQLTHSQHTANTQLTTTKELKNYKNVNNEKNNIIKFDFKKSLTDLEVDEKIVNDWMLVRKNKKATNSETSFNRIKNQINISGLTANQCIKIAVERDWKGFEAEWLKSIKTEQQTGIKRKPILGVG